MASIFDSHASTQGERATETAHRKVELQAPADLTYLIANVSKAARSKIDKHLPPDAAQGDDAMRKRVEQFVDEYIRDTFNTAKHSMSINGMDSREMEAELAKAQEGEEIESYDTKLAKRIQDLSADIERHTLDLANLRRNAPAQTAQRFQESFEQTSRAYDARLEKDADAQLRAARNATVDVGDVQRLDEMRDSWQTGTEELAKLKTGLGSTVARMEKAEQAVGVLER